MARKTNVSKKRAPMIDDPKLQLVINRIYNDINELIGAVNVAANDTFPESSGSHGNIRVTEKSDRTTAIEIRTSQGWFELGGFTMIDKRG